MDFFKHIQITIVASLPILCIAQNKENTNTVKPPSTAADCPSWNNKPANNRADFLEYLRHSQGKKVNPSDPYLANAKMLNVDQAVIEPGQKSVSKNDFYTRKRYNLFPDKTTQGKSETFQRSSVRSDGNAGAEPVPHNDIEKSEITTVISTPAQEIISEPKIETQINEPVAPSPKVETTEPSSNKETGNTKVESGKTKTSWLKRKFNRIFSKKTNKPAKPNYKKCATKF